MIERIFIAMALTITIPAFAHADAVDFSGIAWSASEVEDLKWRALSGASQNGNRPLTIVNTRRYGVRFRSGLYLWCVAR